MTYLSGSELPRDIRYQRYLFSQDKYGNVNEIYVGIKQHMLAFYEVTVDFPFSLKNLLAIIDSPDAFNCARFFSRIGRAISTAQSFFMGTPAATSNRMERVFSRDIIVQPIAGFQFSNSTPRQVPAVSFPHRIAPARRLRRDVPGYK